MQILHLPGEFALPITHNINACDTRAHLCEIVPVIIQGGVGIVQCRGVVVIAQEDTILAVLLLDKQGNVDVALPRFKYGEFAYHWVVMFFGILVVDDEIDAVICIISHSDIIVFHQSRSGT